MINIMLSGCCGKMGKAIAETAAADENLCIICGIDKISNPSSSFPVYQNPDDYDGPVDVIIDFSHPSVLLPLLTYAEERKIPIVIATTGLNDEQIQEIVRASEIIPVFRSANMSVGVNLLVKLVQKAAEVLSENFDIEIIEKHHNSKIDAPSGTAIMIADSINEALNSSLDYVYDRHSVRRKRDKSELGIHSVRGGTIVGEHEVIFAGNDEIISISHTALSKKVFAEGAIKAAAYIKDKAPGLYDMNSVIG